MGLDWSLREGYAWAEDKEHSWRWGEQWMPHAAWLMHALVLADRSVREAVFEDDHDQS